MEYSKLLAKVEAETGEKNRTSQNYADALSRVPPQFAAVVEAWVNGAEPEFQFQGITLSAIRRKERCSYFRALLRMQILLRDPALAAGYLYWRPVNKDWGR